MKKISKIIFLLIFLSFSLVIPRASAQIPGEGLTISPPLLELTLKPEQISTQIIKITNPTQKLMEVYPVVMNFGARGEGGDPSFFPVSEEEARFSLGNWIKFSQTKVALEPEQVVEFNYNIEVPANAEPGGHYGVVFFSTEPPKISGENNQVAISSMIGCLILVKVPGAIVEKGFLEEFSAKKFYFKPPVDFKIRITNLGNMHFKPVGEVSLKSWTGREAAKIGVNEKKGNVLPDSTRKFEEKWEASSSPFWRIPIGRFIANLHLTYGESEKTIDGKLVFWIIPWWLIIAAGIFVLLIIILITWLIVRRRRRRRILGNLR